MDSAHRGHYAQFYFRVILYSPRLALPSPSKQNIEQRKVFTVDSKINSKMKKLNAKQVRLSLFFNTASKHRDTASQTSAVRGPQTHFQCSNIPKIVPVLCLKLAL
ncbi:hypothetical protein CHS0354_018872 [Potamilus streckersoni]|uniref:Uncharacterized protein n=1 Tax=Potamilus streckersoni TaxID=2493646 RepID=A0AAE0SC77_9BIVA|nr:hypothetical protein CHS0354_018872 [Potamilus streckersoni]